MFTRSHRRRHRAVLDLRRSEASRARPGRSAAALPSRVDQISLCGRVGQDTDLADETLVRSDRETRYGNLRLEAARPPDSRAAALQVGTPETVPTRAPSS